MNPYLLSESDNKPLVERILDVGLESGADLNVRWTAGIVLLADCLLRLDEFNRERLLRGLEGELREALRRIPEIQRNGHNPVSLQ
jgi:hypothetical protein